MFENFWEKLLTASVSARNTCVHSVARAASSSTPTTFVKLVGLVALVPRDCISRSPTWTIVFIEAHSPSLFWPAARVVCCISQMDNLNVMLDCIIVSYIEISFRDAFFVSFLFFFSIKSSRETVYFSLLYVLTTERAKEVGGFFSFRVKNSRGYSPVSVLIALGPVSTSR